MTLTDRYLNAVAAQLPRDLRDDVVAELRDDLLSRMEAREAELGRPLTEADEEAVLREMGHPLAVAARYRPGPQHLVGPDLWPMWFFGVKVGVAAVAALAVLGAVIQVLVGEFNVSHAFARAFNGAFNGAIMLIGYAALAAFIIERMERKPRFLTEWRVRDLPLFEAAALDTDGFERSVRDSGGDGTRRRRRRGARSLPPAARAMASAAAWVVILLWWVGAVRIGELSLQDVSLVRSGVDYGAMILETARLLWVPIIVYAGCRIAFDLFRVGRPRAVRMAALGDIGLAAARLAGWVWVLLHSPLAATVNVAPGVAVERMQGLFHGYWSVPAVLTLIVVANVIEAGWRILASGVRLATGEDRRLRG